jgi:ABC-2 type transport system permease protein
MLKRILAVFVARNREFVRDRGTLAWNILMPVILVFGLAFVFGGEGRNQYTVGVLQPGTEIDAGEHPFLDLRYIEFVPVTDEDDGLRKVARHRLDLLVRFGADPHYWVNPESPRGYMAERLLMQSAADAGGRLQRAQISGEPIRYVDWVLPGILGMNMMFSCLFGVGYVVVRYRKNGFLKRLRATPLRPSEFIIAQVASRLALVLIVTAFVYVATHLILDTRMDGNYFTLGLVAIVGGISMVSLGLLIAARVTSEELAGGLLNMISWPMMILSGVWFSLEGAGPAVQGVAKLFPLTHVLDAARAVMLDGATLIDIAPSMIMLTLFSLAFLALGAKYFRWGPD